MILTSARGPCMQKYLDNSSNVAQQPNENYAREIMELHTLGVSGGYTEPDVAEVARVFTGWTYETLNSGTPQASVRFKFNPSKHDHGPKTVMGWSTPGYTGDMGESEGEDLIKYLATHPATIRRMATKLCTYFVHEATPVRFRRKIESHLTNEQPMSVILGSLAEYVAGDNTTARLKTQDPAEFVVSTLRRLDIPFTTSLSTINNWITNLGKQLFYQHLPTGYAEEGAEWNGAGSQLKRWSFVHNLTNNLISGISVPWATLHGTGHTSATHRYNQAIDELVERLVDGELDSISRTNLRAFASTRMSYWSSPPTSLQELGLTRDLVGLILRLPEAATH
jgi:uncharacterized protein (DUF1800 family)